ncbi:hypothetical protein KEF29_34430 [Streptomyces tuirus]|uniref:Uncharacterized protein n=1 Tax=Streptomyces tuirus TaxID=68278 RepID=A0A941J5J5_9ACTN|nr:hypothetical protein [Streptomyces tuirus]
MPRRSHSTTTAPAAPTTNAIRQPQDSICAALSSCCRTICRPSAVSWPAMRVTYWKLEY